MAYSEEQKRKIAEAILAHNAIKYVYISPKDRFFVIKVPGVTLGGERIPEGRFIHLEQGFDNLNVTDIPGDSCVMLFKDRIFTRDVDEIVDAYLDKYEKEIFDAPEFLLSNYFTRKTKMVNLKTLKEWEDVPKEFDKTKVETFDCLVPRKVKVQDKEHFKYICDLLREVGLLHERRGKIKSVDETTKQLRKFIIREFKSMKKKKPLPLTLLRKKLEDEAERLFPEDSELAEKYSWGVETIRRIIESNNKK